MNIITTEKQNTACFDFLTSMKEVAQHDNDNDPGMRLRLKIVPHAKEAIYMNTATLVRVLNALGQSMQSLFSAELLARYSDPKPALKKEITQLVSGSSLYLSAAVIEEGIFEFRLAGLEGKTGFHLLKDARELPEKLFTLFLEAVFIPELFSPGHIHLLCNRYGAKERVKIFGPVYADFVNPQNSYQIYFSVGAGQTFHSWEVPADIETISNLIPEPVKKTNAGEAESYYQYLKTGEINDLFGKRSKYEKVLIKETAKHDVYPFQLQKIRVKGRTYRFGETLSAIVSVEDGHYRIRQTALQLSVSHQMRAGAEQAFEAQLALLILQLEKSDHSSKDAKARSLLTKLKDMLVEGTS